MDGAEKHAKRADELAIAVEKLKTENLMFKNKLLADLELENKTLKERIHAANSGAATPPASIGNNVNVTPKTELNLGLQDEASVEQGIQLISSVMMQYPSETKNIYAFVKANLLMTRDPKT